MAGKDKFNKFKTALGKASDEDTNARLAHAEHVASQSQNPLRSLTSSELANASTSIQRSTFTRESTIAETVHETGNKTPYFLRAAYSLIDENPFNARVNYKQQRIHKLALEIKADGQMVPGLATIRNGRIILAAGHYRWKSIGVALIGYMDLMIYEGISDRELYKLSYKENAEREDQTVIDNALAWKKLLDERVYESESSIAEETGISLPNVNKILSLLQLPKSVLNFIEEQEEKNLLYHPCMNCSYILK